MPAVAGSAIPPALQVDDSGGRLFWCVTTYRAGEGATRCGLDSLGPPTDAFRWWGASSGAGRQRPAPGIVPVAGAADTVDRPRRAPPGAGVHHYNLCSAACGRGARPHSRDVITWFAAQERPVALSLNELCYDDSVHLASRLPADLAAGASFVALEVATGCPGVVRQFGNQVRVRSTGTAGAATGVAAHTATDTAWWAAFPTQAEGPCDQLVRECRGLACAAGSQGGGTPHGGRSHRFTACSAHLESARRSPGTTRAQATEYRNLVERRAPAAVHRVLAGDFNLDGAATDAVFAGPDQLQPRYTRPETGPTISAHTAASGEIDFVYFGTPSPWTAPAAPAGTTWCDRQASDHCYVMTAPAAPAGTTWCDRQASDHCYVMTAPAPTARRSPSTTATQTWPAS